MKRYASLFSVVTALACNCAFAQCDEVASSVEGKPEREKEAVSNVGDEKAEESNAPSLQHEDQNSGCGCNGKGKKN